MLSRHVVCGVFIFPCLFGKSKASGAHCWHTLNYLWIQPFDLHKIHRLSSASFFLKVCCSLHQRFRRIFSEVTFIGTSPHLCSLENRVYLCFSPLVNEILNYLKSGRASLETRMLAGAKNNDAVCMTPKYIPRCACWLIGWIR